MLPFWVLPQLKPTRKRVFRLNDGKRFFVYFDCAFSFPALCGIEYADFWNIPSFYLQQILDRKMLIDHS